MSTNSIDTSFLKPLGDTKLTSQAILLIDASGSVMQKFHELSVFDKMADVCHKRINAEGFRLIFWNSVNLEKDEQNTNFPNGIIKMHHIVPVPALKQAFSAIKTKITKKCLTFPHLGFNAIPQEWISNKDPTHIYFVTDGQMGFSNVSNYDLQQLKSKLYQAIESLFKKYNNIHLHVYTVENQNRDYNDFETLKTAAGGDVFDVIQSNGLTKFVTEFVSYSLNNVDGFRHICNVIPPQGYIPFLTQCFSETDIGKFMPYLKDLIIKTQSEEGLLHIIQNLSITIKYLIRDKPVVLINQMLDNFCGLFLNSAIDSSIVQFILADSIRLENEGKAIVFSQYRSKLKDLYKQAQDLLTQNVRTATGIVDCFFSIPLPLPDGSALIITGSSSNVDKTMIFSKGKATSYPQGAVTVEEFMFPVLPMRINLSSLNEQCVRQWVRAIIANQYNVDQMGDIVIFVVLGLMLRVLLSSSNDEQKDIFRNLGYIMLKKKRLNTDTTELQRIEEGHLPLSNSGKTDEFYKNMNTVKNLLELRCSPLTLWYAICLALNNEQLRVKQLIHCVDAIKVDFPGLNDPAEVLSVLASQMKPVNWLSLPENIDYKCVITLDDCSETGGWQFLPHKSLSNYSCSPTFLVSDEAYNRFTNQEQIFCPICYQQLNQTQFKRISPRSLLPGITVFPDGTNKTIFSNGNYGITTTNGNTNSNSNGSSSSSTVSSINQLNGKLLFLKGTVGSGKTFYAKKIQEMAEAKGYIVFNEGTDKYCKTGLNISSGIARVNQELEQVYRVDPNKKVLIIIDTCGESTNSKKVFGHDFSKFKQLTYNPNYIPTDMEGYMAWSLRNVLQRSTDSSSDTPYWLNPHGAGLQICVNVHLKKAQTLFGKKLVSPCMAQQITTIENVCAQITPAADRYTALLGLHKDVEKELIALSALF